MKKSLYQPGLITLWVVLLFLSQTGGFPALAQGQNQEPSQLHHEYKIYADTESRQIFWPQQLPVYVWLSASASQNAPKHRLEAASLKNSEGYQQQEEAQINLELSGNQFLRWINYETKDTLMLKFQSDGIAPVSGITLAGAERFLADSILYKGRGLKASIQAQDEHAGVAAIYVSINGAEYSPYFGTYDFSQEKAYHIAYYAVDNVGNSEKPRSVAFHVDLTPPVTRHQVTGLQQGSILTLSTRIELSSRDELSGLKYIYYYFDGEEDAPQPYSEALSIAHLAEGTHTLHYFAVDNVGNTENPRAFEFYLDNSPPATELIVEGDFFPAEKDFISGQSRFRFQSADNKTGVSNINYAINGGEETRFNGTPVSMSALSGPVAITFWAGDNLNNKEPQKERTFYIDTRAPETTYAFEGPSFTQRGKTWISSKTKLSLQATDEESGVKQIFTGIDGQKEQPYVQALAFPNEGETELRFYAIDNVSNRENTRQLVLVIDNTPPVVVSNFSTSKIGSANADDGTVLDLYPAGTVLYLAVTDESSGAGDIWISTNGSEETRFSGSLSLDQAGEYTIVVRSADRVANEAIATLRFIISD